MMQLHWRSSSTNTLGPTKSLIKLKSHDWDKRERLLQNCAPVNFTEFATLGKIAVQFGTNRFPLSERTSFSAFDSLDHTGSARIRFGGFSNQAEHRRLLLIIIGSDYNYNQNISLNFAELSVKTFHWKLFSVFTEYNSLKSVRVHPKVIWTLKVHWQSNECNASDALESND